MRRYQIVIPVPEPLHRALVLAAGVLVMIAVPLVVGVLLWGIGAAVEAMQVVADAEAAGFPDASFASNAVLTP